MPLLTESHVNRHGLLWNIAGLMGDEFSAMAQSRGRCSKSAAQAAMMPCCGLMNAAVSGRLRKLQWRVSRLIFSR